jgi:hypothetical protein
MSGFPNFPVYERPASIVEEQIAAMSERADSAINTARQTITELSNVGFGIEPETPRFELPSETVMLVNVSKPTAPGTSVSAPEPVEFSLLNGIDNQLDDIISTIGEIAPFEPSFDSIVIPPPPQLSSFVAPVRPELTQHALPSEPSVSVPTLGELTAISLPEFSMPTLPVFEDMAVSFDGIPPDTGVFWAEPTYTALVLDDVAREVKRMLAGGTGLHPAVESALFSRARTREDSTALKRVQDAFSTFAARGFAMPPGMLAEQVNVIGQENQLQSNALSREILIKSAEWEIENLRVAVTNGIALETMLIAQFENVCKRVFEAAVQTVRFELEVYQQAVALYNARQAARQIAVEVFKGKLQAALATLDVYKARIEAEQAKASLNESIVRAYAARVDAMRNIVAVYTAQIEAVKVKSEIERQKVELYQSDVAAYAALISSDKSRFDAYEAQVRGESAKAQIIQAQAQAFAATVEAQSAQGNVKISAIRGKVDGWNAAVNRYQADIQAERSRIDASIQTVLAGVQAFQAKVQLYSAEVGENSEHARLEITQLESRLRNSLAYYEVRMREFDQQALRLIEKSRVVVSANTAAGQMASTLASGAMSAMHVQASLSGSGSASTSASTSKSENTNYNYERE